MHNKLFYLERRKGQLFYLAGSKGHVREASRKCICRIEGGTGLGNNPGVIVCDVDRAGHEAIAWTSNDFHVAPHRVSFGRCLVVERYPCIPP